MTAEMKSPSIFSRLPVLHALAIQLISIPLVAFMLFLLREFSGLELGIGMAAVLLGVVAALVSRLRGLALWWLPIQLLLPPAIVFALAIQLPAWIFLAAFFVLLSLYWATLFTRVPLYLSSNAMHRCVADLLPSDRAISFVDIGSGLGGVVIFLADLRPDCHFFGIELAPLPWLTSRIRASIQRSRAQIVHGDYNRLDLSRFDVVFVYLSPVVMSDVWKKAKAEMQPGSLLLSCEFPVAGAKPDIVLHPKPGNVSLYGWRM